MTTPASTNESKAEPEPTTAEAKWWEEDPQKLLRESEKARRRNGPLPRKPESIFEGYPTRYHREGFGYGQVVASFLNDVNSGRKVFVRVAATSSLSALQLGNDAHRAAQRIIQMIKNLQALEMETVEENRRLYAEKVKRALDFYGERPTIFIAYGPWTGENNIMIVPQKEPVKFVVVDDKKLQNALDLLARLQSREVNGLGCEIIQGGSASDGSVPSISEIVTNLTDAVLPGAMAEEHKIVNYVLELAQRHLLHKLQPCECSCGCGQWLFQIKRTHTICKTCRRKSHIKSDELKEKRRTRAREIYAQTTAKIR